jgi:hypothetical protein
MTEVAFTPEISPVNPPACTRFVTKGTLKILTEVLGPTVVSTIGGGTSTTDVAVWDVNPSELTRENVLALDAALIAWRGIASVDGDDVARAWFISDNRFLDGAAPFFVLREGRLKDFLSAADAQYRGTWSI